MRKTKINFTNLSFSAFAIVLLLLAFLSFKKANEQATAADWVSHSQVVKLNLTEALNVLLTAETSQRGYILTKDTSFLKHFLVAKKSLSSKIAEIAPLVKDNPEQQENLKITSSYFQKRIDWMIKVLDTFIYLNPKTLDMYLLQGQLISDTLNNQVLLMKAMEDRLLAKRIDQKQKEEKNAARFILLFSLFAIVILLYSFFRLKKESATLSASLYTNAVLEEKVKERTAEIQQANKLFENQNATLLKQNEELSSFTFIANHDLKEPLRKIEMFCQQIMDNDKSNISEKSQLTLEKLKQSTYRMKKLLDGIFNYAQILIFR